jgi:hypothetical protein
MSDLIRRLRIAAREINVRDRNMGEIVWRAAEALALQHDEIERLREALRRAADEPSIDRARAIADEALK